MPVWWCDSQAFHFAENRSRNSSDPPPRRSFPDRDILSRLVLKICSKVEGKKDRENARVTRQCNMRSTFQWFTEHSNSSTTRTDSTQQMKKKQEQLRKQRCCQTCCTELRKMSCGEAVLRASRRRRNKLELSTVPACTTCPFSCYSHDGQSQLLSSITSPTDDITLATKARLSFAHRFLCLLLCSLLLSLLHLEHSGLIRSFCSPARLFWCQQHLLTREPPAKDLSATNRATLNLRFLRNESLFSFFHLGTSSWLDREPHDPFCTLPFFSVLRPTAISACCHHPKTFLRHAQSSHLYASMVSDTTHPPEIMNHKRCSLRICKVRRQTAFVKQKYHSLCPNLWLHWILSRDHALDISVSTCCMPDHMKRFH